MTLQQLLKQHGATMETRITVPTTDREEAKYLRRDLYDHFDVVQSYSTPFDTVFICTNE